MKFQYILLLLFAVFITGLADGLEAALSAIPAVGIVLGLTISYCINITMGAGLLLALASQDMYHPRFSPFGIIGGLIPGINVLPFWVGLVIAGIVYKENAEGGDLAKISGIASTLQSTYLSNKTPFQKMRSAASAVWNERRATGRPPQASNEGELEQRQEEKSRTLANLKSPGIAPSMAGDVLPARNRPANQSYAKTA